MNMYFVYILECSDGSYYTGYTVNVERRLATHNEGKGSRITRSKRPLKLVHQEEFGTKGEAMSREAEIKGWTRAEKVALVEGL